MSTDHDLFSTDTAGLPQVRKPELIRLAPCGLPECSGQRWPTGAAVMHSAQIGRPHSEHETNVSRFGWR